jgi:hypothetical protein
MPMKTNYISAFLLLNFHKKNILIKCDYLKKRKNLFKNDFFLRKLKNIFKGQQKCPVAT